MEMHVHGYGWRLLADAPRLDLPFTRNMVASSSPLVASAYPPEGYRLMSDADAVRAWLASFRGAIAAANYADEMIEAGYDSLDNMIFSKDELQESVASLNDKPGHASRAQPARAGTGTPDWSIF